MQSQRLAGRPPPAQAAEQPRRPRQEHGPVSPQRRVAHADRHVGARPVRQQPAGAHRHRYPYRCRRRRRHHHHYLRRPGPARLAHTYLLRSCRSCSASASFSRCRSAAPGPGPFGAAPLPQRAMCRQPPRAWLGDGPFPTTPKRGPPALRQKGQRGGRRRPPSRQRRPATGSETPSHDRTQLPLGAAEAPTPLPLGPRPAAASANESSRCAARPRPAPRRLEHPSRRAGRGGTFRLDPTPPRRGVAGAPSRCRAPADPRHPAEPPAERCARGRSQPGEHPQFPAEVLVPRLDCCVNSNSSSAASFRGRNLANFIVQFKRHVTAGVYKW